VPRDGQAARDRVVAATRSRSPRPAMAAASPGACTSPSPGAPAVRRAAAGLAGKLCRRWNTPTLC
jgi:hypothetical protein